MRFFERRPLCNNNPSSAPHIKGRCFILCWRCSGGVIGVFFWYLINNIFLSRLLNRKIVISMFAYCSCVYRLYID